jgi:hypothetical protein
MRKLSTRINAMPRIQAPASTSAGLTIPLSIVYESERFIVVASGNNQVPCFELIDQAANAAGKATEAFLHGASADYLFAVIKTWQINVPDQEEVEAMLDSLIWCNMHVLEVH